MSDSKFTAFDKLAYLTTTEEFRAYIVELEKAIISGQAEINALRHDLDRYMEIAAREASEVERLKRNIEGWKKVPAEVAKAYGDVASRDAEIAAALRQARADALEEAAGVADGTTSYDDAVHKSAGCHTTGQRIATAIRSLKDKQP